MAVGITLSTTSSFASTSRTIVAAHMHARANNAVMTQMVKPYMQPPGSRITNFGVVARVAASALTQGVDLSAPEQLAVKITSTAPTEKGVIVFVTDKFQRESAYPVDRMVARVLADAATKKIDDDGITQLAGFAKAVPGASSALDLVHFRGAMAYLSTDNDSAYGPAPMPRVAVLHPEQVSDIVMGMSDPSSMGRTIGVDANTGRTGIGWASGMSSDILMNWWRGSDKAYGIPIFEDGNIVRDANSDSRGGLFSMTQDPNPPDGAMYYATEKEPRVESERDISLRGDEVGSFWDDQWGEMVDPWGVGILSDTAATI